MQKGIKIILVTSFVSICTMELVIWQKKANQRKRHAGVLRDISNRIHSTVE